MVKSNTNKGHEMKRPTETPLPADVYTITSNVYPYTEASRMALEHMKTRIFVDSLTASQLFAAARTVYAVETMEYGQRSDDWKGRDRWASDKWGARFFGVMIELGGRSFELRSFGPGGAELVEA